MRKLQHFSENAIPYLVSSNLTENVILLTEILVPSIIGYFMQFFRRQAHNQCPTLNSTSKANIKILILIKKNLIESIFESKSKHQKYISVSLITHVMGLMLPIRGCDIIIDSFLITYLWKFRFIMIDLWLKIPLLKQHFLLFLS